MLMQGELLGVQDMLAIVAKLGTPDYFITFTCNPKWPEILAELLPGQAALDRPDVVARVFYVNVTELMNDLTKEEVLGRVTVCNPSYCQAPNCCKLGWPLKQGVAVSGVRARD